MPAAANKLLQCKIFYIGVRHRCAGLKCQCNTARRLAKLEQHSCVIGTQMLAGHVSAVTKTLQAASSEAALHSMEDHVVQCPRQSSTCGKVMLLNQLVIFVAVAVPPEHVTLASIATIDRRIGRRRTGRPSGRPSPPRLPRRLPLQRSNPLLPPPGRRRSHRRSRTRSRAHRRRLPSCSRCRGRPRCLQNT